MITRQGVNERDYKTYDTARLREEFLVEKIFLEGSVTSVYSHVDRILFGGIMPLDKPLELDFASAIHAAYPLERREMGAINIGGDGVVTVNGKKYAVKNEEAIYVGRGNKQVIFESVSPSKPAEFYYNTCPAHKEYPTRIITSEQTLKVCAGSKVDCNERVINKYLTPATGETCQLSMGLTKLKDGSVWNTMPSHTHERRMEVYFYFDVQKGQTVFHFMGPKTETRHITVQNKQAVISPAFSIHSGVGTKNYSFIWGMCGENQDYDDMDAVKTEEIL